MKELATLIAKLQSLAKARFHGSVTIHWTNGIPKKVKTELSEDL